MLRTRVVTALILLAVLLGSLAWSRLAFATLACALVAAALFEWLRLAAWPQAACLALALLAAVVMFVLAWRLHFRPSLPLYGLFALASATWIALAGVLVRAQLVGVRIGRPLVTVLAFILLAAAWAAILFFLTIGPLMLLSVLAIVWVADIAAYFAGRAFGKRKLAPRISPGKTWAGVGGAMVAVVAVAVVAWLLAPTQPLFSNRLIGGLSLPLAALTLVVLVAASIVGDLFESLLKRQAGVKDSSGLLPGHGGVFDRIDALVPVLPAAALVQLWVR